MTPRTWLLLGWIVVGTAVLIAHAALLYQVLRSDKVELGWRLAALVPPVAPFVGWACGKRKSVVVWSTLVVTYAALRAAKSLVT